MDDDRQQVFQGTFDGFWIVHGHVSKLPQMAERFVVQSLEPVAEMEGMRTFPVRQKAQEVRGKPQRGSVDAGDADLGFISVQRYCFPGISGVFEKPIA